MAEETLTQIEAKGEEQEEQKPNFTWLPEGFGPLADGEYDAIVMGTGLKECIIGGLLSVMGMRILQVDRNPYYGGEAASLNLRDFFAKFRQGQEAPSDWGRSVDWNVDLIPKFIMAEGNLVKILLHTKVTRYLEFLVIDGSFVYKDAKILKVPATPNEALASSLMGMFEKRRFRSFLVFVAEYDENKPSSHQGKDLRKMTMQQLFDSFSLDANTASFVGHAMALHRDDDYLQRPALETVKAVQLYSFSLQRYGKSPYIYPIYGLSSLAEGFSRLCAVYGGTFMLNAPVDEVLFNEEGVAWGIRCGNEIAKASMIVGDPSYFPREKLRDTGINVVRSICILNHPIPNTDNASSTQIIIPARQVNRNHDIYVCMTSFTHCVAKNGFYIAIASTTVETNDPIAELDPAIRLLGPILDRFNYVTTLYEPNEDGASDRCFISKSFDATSHFETATDDVLDLYRRITGQELDMTISTDELNNEES